MAMPAGPGTDLVLVQSDLAFCGFKTRLDGPPCARYPNQIGQTGPLGRQRQIKGERFRLRQLATDQQPLLPAALGLRLIGQPGPVIESRGPLAPSPALSRCQELAGTSSSQSATVLNPSRCRLVTART